MTTKRIMVIIALSIFSAVAAFAAPPKTINYQGYLKNVDGTPATGPKSMVFSLYSSNPARNNPVWRETQPGVAIGNGVFSVQLGSVTPITAQFDAPYFLGVNVAASGELPLQPLSGTAYAFRAGVADSLTPGITVPGATPWGATGSTSFTAAANRGYLLTGATPASIALPTTATVGSVIRINAQGTGGYAFNLANGQSISGAGVDADYEVWTARDSNRAWRSIASSADGTKLAATVSVSGRIYTSTDSGATWTPRESLRNWFGIASSADGAKLAATVADGQIYTSTNSGATWTARESNRPWRFIASSADGSKLAATVAGGQIYTSTDSGVTWIARESAREWSPITSSADGSKLVAAANPGQIFTSTDSGATWTGRGGNGFWSSLASSADGTKLAAADYGGPLYTSTNSGLTWTARESTRFWAAVTSSADGKRLAAGVWSGGRIYISTDSGATWSPRESDRGWSSLAFSADGTKIAATSLWNQQIYTSGVSVVTGAQYSSTELVYAGNGQWVVNQPAPVGSQGAALNGLDQYIIRASGGVGINAVPQATLSIGGAPSVIELGAGWNKETHAGKIGYQLVSSGLDIIGAGTTGDNRKINFWNEGGASFSGDVGIGKTPTVPLDVAGDARVTGSLTAGAASFNGNVGIGTSSPNRTLHLAQAGAVEMSLQVSDGLANWKTWNLLATGPFGAAQNLTFRIINDAGSASTRDVLRLNNTGNVTVPGGDNWDLSNTEGDFRIGNDAIRLKIGVPLGGGGAGDIGIKADGGMSRLKLMAAGGTIVLPTSGGTPSLSASNTDNVALHGSSTNSVGVKGESTNNTAIWGIANAGTAIDGVSASGYGVLGRTGNNIGVLGRNNSTDAPAVEGHNIGTGDLFRGWAGASPALKFRVYNNGDGWMAGTLSQASDLRLKTDILPLEDALDKVMRLRGVSYLMKDDAGRTRRIGVVAQELELEYPELVATDDKGMKSVAYGNLAPVLIEALKELKSENEALQRDNAALKSRLDRLEKAVFVP